MTATRTPPFPSTTPAAPATNTRTHTQARTYRIFCQGHAKHEKANTDRNSNRGPQAPQTFAKEATPADRQTRGQRGTRAWQTRQ
eukprot:3047991-Alexandrium_andersonii.AAC.1